MITRRQFVGRGLGVLAGSIGARPAWAQWLTSAAAMTSGQVSSDPVAAIMLEPSSIMIDGFPFARWFTGDDFKSAGQEHLPVPPFMNPLNPNHLPEPSESVQVAIVGGGLSGLTSAYLLRDLQPLLLDIHQRFGGAARGEQWAGTNYSLGNAYVITPDPGTFLDNIYSELGLDQAYKLSESGDPVEIDGQVLEDFWVNGYGGSREEIAALADYASVVCYMADEGYPNIPYSEREADYIAALDQKTLKQDILDRMKYPVPPLLESAIQGYCFSSFGAGWDQISAVGGWNFLAAEEYGRWVFPGGTPYMARALWQRLRAVEQNGGKSMLRGGCAVLNVRLQEQQVQVTYRDPEGALQSVLADYVIMACPKFICKHIISDLAELDAEKEGAMNVLSYAPYLVANVLLDHAIDRDFYDIFLLGNSREPLGFWYPCGLPFEQDDSPVTDVLNGAYTRVQQGSNTVLTLYWPLMCATARYELVFQDPFERWATRLTAQLDEILALFKVTRDNVVQVRLSRWGHAMPLAAPALIAGGTIEKLRRPIQDRLFFVNQDNWALPAVENSMLDAEIMTNQIRELIRR